MNPQLTIGIGMHKDFSLVSNVFTLIQETSKLRAAQGRKFELVILDFPAMGIEFAEISMVDFLSGLHLYKNLLKQGVPVLDINKDKVLELWGISRE